MFIGSVFLTYAHYGRPELSHYLIKPNSYLLEKKKKIFDEAQKLELELAVGLEGVEPWMKLAHWYKELELYEKALFAYEKILSLSGEEKPFNILLNLMDVASKIGKRQEYKDKVLNFLNAIAPEDAFYVQATLYKELLLQDKR